MIAHDLVVNRHGGLIDFDSEEGRGVVFVIKLTLNSTGVLLLKQKMVRQI